MSLALLLPAQAQFWEWGNRPRPPQQIPFGGGGGWFGGRDSGPRIDTPREAPVDYSRAPGPSYRRSDAATSIVVMGDGNADWLAYGLEDAFSEKSEFGVVRKHRTDSGLIRYDPRREIEWSQVAREIIAAEKPKFIVMMVGNHDRQAIRERTPAAARPGAPKPAASPAQPAQNPSATTAPVDPEQQPEQKEVAEPPANLTPEQTRVANYGPWEFHTEKWELAYIKRVDATIAALKSAGVPVLWVGLPSQRGPKSSSDSAYLNEIYRSRAERAGIAYVDIWDGFVDEGGRFSPQGPDYEGQIRRLRTNDGVYFTKFGARKLAHYVEREIQRHVTNRGLPVALPIPEDTGPQAPNVKPGGPAQRPVVGPVVPLTAAKVVPEELLGGGRAPPRPAVDATATRVLTKGEPIAAPSGRADDFSWPRGTVNVEPAVAQPSTSPAAAAGPATAPPAAKSTRPARPATDAQAIQSNPSGEQRPPAQRRARSNWGDAPRPPLSIQGLFRW